MSKAAFSTRGAYDRTFQKFAFSYKNNLKNIFKTYLNYEDFYNGTTSDSSTWNFIVLKNGFDQFKLNKHEQLKELSIFPIGSAEKVLYNIPRKRSLFLEEMTKIKRKSL